MRSKQIDHPDFGKILVTYGFDHKMKQYFANVISTEKLGEASIVMSIGTLHSVVPHPYHRWKRQFSNNEMALIWKDLGVPESDRFLLLNGMPV